MSKRTTLFLILVAALGVFLVKWQGPAFFTDSVLAEEEDSETTLIAPSDNTGTESKTDTEADTQSKKNAKTSAASAGEADTQLKEDIKPNTTSKYASQEKINTAKKQVEAVTISTPTFTTRGTSANTRSSSAGTSPSSRNTSERSATTAVTTNTNTQSSDTGTSTSSGNTSERSATTAATNAGTPVKKDLEKETKKDTKPGTAYIAPISGSLQVTTTAEDAERVEYYSQSKKSDTETYLGAGQSTSSGEWSLDIDAANRLPNGEYDVSAKAKRKDGTVVQSQPAQLNVAIPENRISQVEKAKFENSKEDADGDGVSDKEEIRLGANPQSADTDQDGFLDGDEIKNGFDPLKFSAGDKSDKIVFESPKEVIANTAIEPETKKISDKRFKVDTVELVTAANDGKKATRFSGKALPNMFITLYIYSYPIIVTVKTDAEGNWTYDLDKELPDGDHEIFVAVTDNVGKISAQSEALPFVKTAQAVAIKPAAAAAAEALQNASPLDRSRTEFIIMAIVIALSFLGIALVVIGRKASVIQ